MVSKEAHFLGDFLFKTFLLQKKQKIHNVGRQQCFGGWVSDGFSFYQLGVVQRCTWGVHDPTWRVFLQTLLQDVSLFHETSMVFVEVFSMKRLLLTLPTIMLGKSGSSDSFPWNEASCLPNHGETICFIIFHQSDKTSNNEKSMIFRCLPRVP